MPQYRGNCAHCKAGKDQFRNNRGYNIASWSNVNFPYQSDRNTKLCHRCYLLFKDTERVDSSVESSIPSSNPSNAATFGPNHVASASISLNEQVTSFNNSSILSNNSSITSSNSSNATTLATNHGALTAISLNQSHANVLHLGITKLDQIDISSSSLSNQKPAPKIRAKRPYDTIAESTKHSRNKKLRGAVSKAEIEYGVTAKQAGLYNVTAPKEEAVKLSQSIRDKVTKNIT